MLENPQLQPISSQASEESVEGSTTRTYSPDRAMKSHERAATKVCKTCGVSKPINQFSARNAHCKPCAAANELKRYYAKRDEIRSKQRAYYYANQETLLAQKSEYGSRPEVKERNNEYRRVRYASDAGFRERYERKNKRHYAENKSLYRARDARRRADLLMATPQWADKVAIRAFYAEAERRTLETGVLHVVDHIVPLMGRNVRGLHVAHNLRVIEDRENKRKFNRLVDDVV